MSVVLRPAAVSPLGVGTGQQNLLGETLVITNREREEERERKRERGRERALMTSSSSKRPLTTMCSLKKISEWSKCRAE